MGQVNRENTKAEVPFAPTQRLDGNGVIPGYRGHVPNVVNAVGMSTYLSGPGFTEVKAENMEKMGGAGDLGDSAAAYGMNDWGASSFSDGAADMDNLGGLNITSSMAKDSASAGGFVDTWTPGDEMAAKAEAAKAEAAAWPRSARRRSPRQGDGGLSRRRGRVPQRFLSLREECRQRWQCGNGRGGRRR